MEALQSRHEISHCHNSIGGANVNSHLAAERKALWLLLMSIVGVASRQQLPSPCGSFEGPRLVPRDDMESPVPNQPIPLSTAIHSQKAPDRQPVHGSMHATH